MAHAFPIDPSSSSLDRATCTVLLAVAGADLLGEKNTAGWLVTGCLVLI
jgi:hypothetical protein